jgi:hypothetical protein
VIVVPLSVLVGVMVIAVTEFATAIVYEVVPEAKDGVSDSELKSLVR